MAAPIPRAFLQKIPNYVKNSSKLIDRHLSRRLHLSCRRSEKWQIYSAVCVQRHPVITQPARHNVQQKYTELLEKMEFENSVLSDHELRHRKDLAIAEARKDDSFKESDLTIGLTAIEFEDAAEVELKKFIPAERTTEADKQNDLKSLDRKLERKLVLLVKQKLGNKEYWCFPQIQRSEGQSMRQSAECALSELCGDIDAQILGNAPSAFFKYKYTTETQAQEKCDGAKVFFYKATFSKGIVAPKSPNVSDHMWVTLDELPKYITSQSYKEKIRDFMFEL